MVKHKHTNGPRKGLSKEDLRILTQLESEINAESLTDADPKPTKLVKFPTFLAQERAQNVDREVKQVIVKRIMDALMDGNDDLSAA